MSKAEEFIQENTRNCSQLHYNSACTLRHCITPDQAIKAVEIAREEIYEKIKSYIKSMVNDIAFLDTEGNDSYNLDKFIDDLKQAMKNE